MMTSYRQKLVGLSTFLIFACLSGLALSAFRPLQSGTGHLSILPASHQLDLEGTTANPLQQDEITDGRVRVIIALDIPYRLESEIEEEIVVHVQRHRIAKAQKELQSSLEGFDVEVIRKFRYIPYLTLDVDSAALVNLVTLPVVASVQVDLPVPAAAFDGSLWVEPGLASQVSATGAGWVIAVLDTGVNVTQESLTDSVVGEACFSTTIPGIAASLCPDGKLTATGPGSGAPCPEDIGGCDHGTLMANVSSGSGEYSGVATEAGILSVQVYSQVVGSSCTEFGLENPCLLSFTSDQMAALEWVYEQRSDFDIAAVSLNLGSGEFDTLCDDDLRKPYIDFLLAEGIATIVPAGSDGHSGSVTAPACVSTTISVGTAQDSYIAPDSNLASFTDLLVSTKDIQTALPPGQHRHIKESSLAAAYAAGVWTAFRAEAPAIPADQLLSLLHASGPLIRDNREASEDEPAVEVPLLDIQQAWLSLEQWLSDPDGLEPPEGFHPEATTISDFRFAVTSDMQFATGPGDYDSPDYFRGALEAIADHEDISFMVSPGDVTPVMSTYWTIQKILGEDFAWYPVVGNHDLRDSDINWLQSYDYGQVYAGPDGCPQTTYAFDYEDSHFIMLNVYCDESGNRATEGDISTHLYAWLAEDLQNTDKSHIFVLGHEPAYPRKDEHNGVLRHLGGSLDADSGHRDRFWNLLSQYAVDAYICGHSHAYSAIKLDNVWQVNSGHAQGEAFSLTDSTFLVLSVDGEQVQLEVYRAGEDSTGYELKEMIQLR